MTVLVNSVKKDDFKGTMPDIVKATFFIQRWGGRFMLGHRRSIGEHSFEVAMHVRNIIKLLGDHISKEEALEAITYSLEHDLPEVVTQDVPYPTKRRYPELKEILDEVEHNFKLENNLVSPNSLSEFIVKVADTVAVAHEITEEVKLGNFGIESQGFIRDIMINCNNKARNSNEITDNIIDICNRYFNINVEYID